MRIKSTTINPTLTSAFISAVVGQQAYRLRTCGQRHGRCAEDQPGESESAQRQTL